MPMSGFADTASVQFTDTYLCIFIIRGPINPDKARHYLHAFNNRLRRGDMPSIQGDQTRRGDILSQDSPDSDSFHF